MAYNKRRRMAWAIVFYVPFVAWVVIKAITNAWRLFLPSNEPDEESLAKKGMSGDFSGTVATWFVNRHEVQSWLPPELTLVGDEELPDWLRERDDHPVILMFGKIESGKRMNFLGRYATVAVFPTFLESFVTVPFVKPKAAGGPSPCFHFSHMCTGAFWPTELGILYAGWPKLQCPMEMSEQGQTVAYSIRDVEGRSTWLTARTDLADAVPLDAAESCLENVISMLSRPLVLVKGRELMIMSFDLRFHVATIKAAPASVTIYPGFLPSIAERTDLTFPKITEAASGAFYLEATFMNQMLDRIEAAPERVKTG